MTGRLTEFARALAEDLGSVVVIEALLTLLVLAGALAIPHLEARLSSALRRWFGTLLTSPRKQLVFVGALAVVLRGVLLPVIPPPQPLYHDEHSLLLQGQTFATGRMTNPPHAFSRHFETFHVNQQPTYSSVFFLGRGLPVTVGVLLGHAWAGIWLSVIFMCVAVCWMLQGWVSLPWALTGGILSVVRFGVFSYWINSYWGGALTAGGAALMLGALPRIYARGRAGDGVWLGVGIVLLITSRPYEGLLFCLPVGLALLVWIFRRPGAAALLRVAVPASAIAAAGAVAMLAHFSSVTGKATVAPYAVHRDKYALAPAFLFSKPLTNKEYPTARMRQFYEWELSTYRRKESLSGLAAIAAARVRQIWIFFIGPLLTIPFCAGLWVARSSWPARFLMLILVIFFAGYLVETWGFAHYASPVMPVILAVIVMGLARLRSLHGRWSGAGRFVSAAVPVACCLVLLVPAASAVLGKPRLDGTQGKHWCCTFSEESPHEAMKQTLEATPGRDLVLVHYTADYPVQGHEWVYNDANIDGSEIVWAHDLGPAANGGLIEYFKDRNVWRIELSGNGRQQLLRYSAAER